MKIYANSNNFDKLILDNLQKIQTNESGKIIDFDSLIIKYDFEKNFNERIIVLNDHSFNDFIEKNKEICLIIFDSKLDLNNRKTICNLINDGFKNILFVGIRNFKKDELIFLKDHKINFIGINSFLEHLNESCDTIMEFSYGKNLYLIINFNVLDPAFIKNNNEVGGLTSRQFFYIINRMSKMKNLQVVELMINNLNNDELTIKIVTKTISEML